jgi:hypothetical protein
MRNARFFYCVFFSTLLICTGCQSKKEKAVQPTTRQELPSSEPVHIEKKWEPIHVLASNPGIIQEKSIRTLDIATLKTGDSVTIQAHHIGCFHFLIEVQTIKKETQGYTVSSMVVKRGTVDSLVGERQYFNTELSGVLRRLQEDCIAFSKKEQYTFSTSYSFFVIRSGNRVWDFSDNSGEWEGYKPFRTTIQSLFDGKSLSMAR